MNTDDPNRIIALIAAAETLANAWRTMLASNTADLDPATVQTASANLDATLAHASSLIHALAAGSGEPTPTRLERRLIASAITHTIGSRLAQETSPAAFPTSGSTTALSERITGMRADGRVKVFRCCLAPMTVHRIIQNASDTLPSLLVGPITTLLSAIAHTRHEPQLVDALRNAALAPIDNAMTDAGHGYARCGQWTIISEPDDARLDAAVALLVATLAARGLLLDGTRTQTTSFDEEFCHLGTDYTATAPAPRTTSATHEASADRIVHVGKDGTRVHVAKGRLLVDSASGVPQKVPPSTQRHPHRAHWQRRPVRRSPLLGAAQRNRRRLPVQTRRLSGPTGQHRRHGERHPPAGPSLVRHRRNGETAAGPRHRQRQNPQPDPRAQPHRQARPRPAPHRHSRPHARLARRNRTCRRYG